MDEFQCEWNQFGDIPLRSKTEIKTAVFQQDRLEIKAKLESSIKVGHKLTEDSENWSYLNTMHLHTARLWSRIRCYAIKVLKQEWSSMESNSY